MRRRGLPVLIVAVSVVGLLGWWIMYTQHVVRELRLAARTQGNMYAITIRALQDTASVDNDRTDALLELAQLYRASGVPMILTDAHGRLADAANLDFNYLDDTVRTLALVKTLDQLNPPVVANLSTVHYGDPPIVRGLQIIPMLQSGAILLLILFGSYGLRERGRAEREKVWAGMAREAAHQLGTPLSSIGGWLELLREQDNGATAQRALNAMEQDLQRLDRVSHRFERIGRPPRSDSVDCSALVARLAAYFAARAPTLAKRVEIVSEQPNEPLLIVGDGVLLEWVLEVLIKNAIDSLGGRDGKVVVSAVALPEHRVRIRVADDGPGIPRQFRKRIFEAGFTTKAAGWGIGLSLARRIVEENHAGKLLLVESDRGAVFDVILNG